MMLTADITAQSGTPRYWNASTLDSIQLTPHRPQHGVASDDICFPMLYENLPLRKTVEMANTKKVIATARLGGFADLKRTGLQHRF